MLASGSCSLFQHQSSKKLDDRQVEPPLDKYEYQYGYTYEFKCEYKYEYKCEDKYEYRYEYRDENWLVDMAYMLSLPTTC
jgi:hypothetical protein